jgi:putative ABC transport system permease protein
VARISLGLAATLVLCLLAALWPAIATGRADTLELLQAGRTAF